MPTTANSITYYVAADGTLRDGLQGSIAQTPRINYGTDYAVTLSFPASTIAEGDKLQVALNRTRTFFSSASATGDAPVAAVAKHDVTAEEAAAQEVAVVLSTNTRAMIDQVNGIDHPVRGFFGVHVLRGQSFVTLAVADALMMSLESGPDAISPSLPVVDYPTREEAVAIKDEALMAAGKAKEEADRAENAAAGIVPPLQLSAPPTTSTVGSVGQLAVWHDSSATDQSKADHEYHLLYIVESAGGKEYIWREDVTRNQGNVAGGYPILDANGKVASAQLPPFSDAPEPIIATTAPTTSTVGVVGQLYLDTVTSKTYHCTAIANTGTESDPVWSYTWTNDINANGGTLKNNCGLDMTGNISHLSITDGYIRVGRSATAGNWHATAIGIGASATGGNQYGQMPVAIGYYAKSTSETIALGKANSTTSGYILVIGNGTSNSARSDIVLVARGYMQVNGGISQNATVIPAATTAYTLAEGVQSHTPEAASVYTLPTVTDATRTHECILTIKFSASVLTYEFQDSEGTTLVPLPLNGDIESGSVVTFYCRYESLLSQWVIMPVMVGKEAQE